VYLKQKGRTYFTEKFSRKTRGGSMIEDDCACATRTFPCVGK